MSVVCRSEIRSESDETLKKEHTATYATICGAISSHLIAIRKLVLIGHDLPAKQVLRSLIEHMDLLNLLWLKPELVEEFRATKDDDAANHFWHKNISKKKLRRQTRDLLLKDVDPDAVTEWRKFRDAEEKVLGSAVHPSAIGCWMATSPAGVHPDIDLPGFMGVRSENSIRTLRCAFASSWELVMNKTFPFGDLRNGKSHRRHIMEFDNSNEFHVAIEIGRQVMNDLMVLIGRWEKSDHPDLQNEFDNWPHTD